MRTDECGKPTGLERVTENMTDSVGKPAHHERSAEVPSHDHPMPSTHEAGHDAHAGPGDHENHDVHGGHDHSGMAVSATLHCLTGCSIGEIIGMSVGTAVGLHTLGTTLLAIALSFVFGYALSSLPLVRAGISLGRALRLVLVADTVSILTMEVVDNIVMLVIPGAMSAGLANPIYWLTMPLSLVLAFFAALPVNRALLKRGGGHAVTHEALMESGADASMDNRPLIFAIIAFILGGLTVSVVVALGLGS